MKHTVILKVFVEIEPKEVFRLRIKYPFELAELEALLYDTWNKQISIKYKDGDGDLCALVFESFTDFLAQQASQQHEKRIFQLYILEQNVAPQMVQKPGTITNIWQVDLGYKGWTNFTEPYASMLNRALAKGSCFTNLTYYSPRGNGSLWKYEIDFSAMSQKNLNTGFVRTIRCVEKDDGVTEHPEFTFPSHGPSGESTCLSFDRDDMIGQYTSLRLPILFKGIETAILLQSSKTGKVLNAALHAQGVDRDHVAIVTLRSEARDAGYLRVNPTTFALEFGGDGKGKEYEFQIVPNQNGCFGLHLCSELTGQLISVDDYGLVMVNAERVYDKSTVFIIRYHPGCDMSWKEDPSYKGKRSWIHDRSCGYYSSRSMWSS